MQSIKNILFLVLFALSLASSVYAINIEEERSQSLWRELNKIDETKDDVEVYLPPKKRARTTTQTEDELSLKAAAPIRSRTQNRAPTTLNFDSEDETKTDSVDYLDENTIDLNLIEKNLQGKDL